MEETSRRYVFCTQGVCCPEIHFRLSGRCLHDVRFMGGGCPGNALLAARLMEGRSAEEVMSLARGIPCRNGTSCPDQLAMGMAAALAGDLAPAVSFKIEADPQPRSRIGLIGAPRGRVDLLQHVFRCMKRHGVESIYCLGNLIGDPRDDAVIEVIEKKSLFAVAGEQEWALAQGKVPESASLSDPKRAWLRALPQAASFQMAGKTGFAFYGRYLQTLEGYSDFEPFALEINMICDLVDFMENAEALEALKAMIPQFSARILVFGQTGRWGFWEIDDACFISVGSVQEESGLSWGLLEARGSKVKFRVIREA
ncbi:MAG: TSCPD domain-containing protein [Deltaproteobacteria bacterium]|nr:TSCPD domain-containing protein [Deltaproteobacteria bacterium]